MVLSIFHERLLLFFSKFWVAVETKRVEIRDEKIKEREEQKKIERYHQKVLESGKPTPLDIATPMPRPQQNQLVSKSASMLNNQQLPIDTVTPLSQIQSPKKKKRIRAKKKTGHKMKKK